MPLPHDPADLGAVRGVEREPRRLAARREGEPADAGLHRRHQREVHAQFVHAESHEHRDRVHVAGQRAADADPTAVPVGIMVETAAAALMAERFAREADFLSIGTNDLTQYTLAMDRTNPRLAPQVDALHPSVLRLIERTAAGARKHGKWTGICGALAGDPQAIPILLGLGVDELSADVPLVPAVKARVRTLSLADCRETARLALAAEDGAQVRALVQERHG